MGGGHVSRPDFGMPQPDAAYPLTEFYLLAQQALEKSGSFMLPALYAGLQAPARRIYREEAAGYLQLAAAPAEGLTRLLSPARMQLLYSSLQVQPDGAPRCPFADRGMYPPDRGGAAAAALCMGGPAAAAAGCSGGAHPAIDHAGRDGHRHRPRRTGAEAGAQHRWQTLAAPPQGRDLSLRAAGLAAKGL